MRKIRHLSIMGLFIFFFHIQSQNLETPGMQIYEFSHNKPLPSPEAENIIRYGNVPVGHFTGTAEVNVPLYNIDIEDYTIPISLSYHTSGIKVSDIASWVGLGWTLNAGGCIVRQINDLPDEYRFQPSPPFTIGTDCGQATYFQQMWNLAHANSSEKSSDTYFDEYQFNFLGFSGTFIMRESHPSIANREGISYTINGMKIYLIGEEPKFKIVKDGFIFEFEKVEYVNFINESYSTENRNLSINQFPYQMFSTLTYVPVPTTWFITSVTTPKNKKIQFIYKEAGNFEKSNTVFNETFGNVFEHCEDYTPAMKFYRNVMHSKTEILNQSYLDSIKFDNGFIKFNSSYSERLDNTNGLRLDSIVVKNQFNSERKTIRFHHEYFITNNNYAFPNRFTKEEDYYRLKLLDVEVGAEKYSFEYNNQSLPVVNSFSIDWDGYYNGNNNQSLLPPYNYGSTQLGNLGVSRDPDSTKMQAASLKKIYYPTKGYTEFQYENHKARYLNAGILGDEITNLGGLRIKRIMNYSFNGEFLEGKEYQYGLDGTGIENFYRGPINIPNKLDDVFHILSNISSNMVTPPYFPCYSTFTLKRYSSYKLRSPYSSSVSYPSVCVFDIDDANNRRGRTCCSYSYEHDSICDYIDEKFKNKSHERGKLLSTKVFDVNNDLKYSKKIEYNSIITESLYNFIIIGAAKNNPQNIASYLVSYDSFFDDRYQWIGNNIIFREIKEEKEVFFYETDSIEKITRYTYNTESPILNIHPTAKVKYSSTGDTIMNKYEYQNPNSISQEAKDYINSIAFYPLIKEKSYKNSLLLKEREIVYSYILTNCFYPNMIKEWNIGETVSRTLSECLSYDSKGNMREIRNIDGITTTFIWSYNFQHLYAIVKNITFSQVSNNISPSLLLNIISSSNYPTDAMINALSSSLRSKFPQAEVTTFTYKLLVGMTSKTDPRGVTTYYEYDNFNRLKEVYLIESGTKKTIQTFDYNYKH